MGSIGRSLDAKGRCRRAVINVSRRNSGRICTTGAGFAQAVQTYNVSPNAKEKSPVPDLIRKYLQRRRGFLMRISNLISLIGEPDLRAAFAHIRQFQFDLCQTLLSERACLFVECGVLL